MAENEMFRNGNGNDASNAGNNGMNNNMSSIAPRDYGVTTPIAPEGGIPAAPGNGMGNIPSTPIAPGGGMPAFPGPQNIPVHPIAPPAPPTPPNRPNFPIFPGVPSTPSQQYFGQVRFLNASTNSFPVNISIDNTTYAINSRFGTISNYDWISDGFHTITVRRATGLRNILLQQTFPFTSSTKVTMVLTDTPSGGLNMVKVTDTGCRNLPYNAGCYRLANMSYSGSEFDLMLYGDEVVFRNVSFQEVTNYKQAMAGSYQFYVTNSGGRFSVIREIPIIVIGAYTNSPSNNEPLISIQVDIAARRNYTTYLIGNNWSENSFRALTVED